jgi:pyruvate/2-oxoglutarate dehydrogenase complex dihydrolipoamide dehydrogenase (E3) component
MTNWRKTKENRNESIARRGRTKETGIFRIKGDLAMKILVFGAGVLGCNLARNFFRAGKDVTLLARGAWGESIPKKRPSNQG